MTGMATLHVTFPLDDRRPAEVHVIPPGICLAAALMRIAPDRWGGMSFSLHYGTRGLETVVEVEEAAGIDLKPGDVWHVVVVPGDVFSAIALVSYGLTYVGVGAVTAGWIATVVVYTAMAAISMAISFAVTMLLAPSRQTDIAPAAADAPTSTNSLSPPRNTMRPASRIPEIYGTMRIWPDLLFPAWTEWNIRDIRPSPEFKLVPETSSEQNVWAVYCVGRGAYNTWAHRFEDAAVATINGEVTVYPPGATLPEWVRMARAVGSLTRVELPGPTATPYSAWYQVPGLNVSEVYVQVSFPGGLYAQVAAESMPPGANYIAWDAVVQVVLERTIGGVVVERREPTFRIGAQTNNELRQTIKIPVNPGQWQVAVAEIGVNGVGQIQSMKRCMLEGIVGFERLMPEHRTFADETVIIVGARNRGTTAAQNLERFNCIVQRILPTQAAYQPAGIMSDPVPNNHWFAAAYHTLTDPFACAYAWSEVDWDSVYAVQAGLDAYGEGEFCGVIDRQISADEQLGMLARKARAQAFISNGRVTFARDERRPGVSALFNRRNTMLERGATGMGLRFPGPEEHDGIEVQWIDRANDWKLRTYTYPENVTPLTPLAIDLTGATDWPTIWRRARYEHAVQMLRRRTMPFRATEEAQLLLPFDRIAVVPPWEEAVVDGEVLEVAGLDLRLSRAIRPIGPQAGIRIRAEDGRQTALIPVAASARGDEWVTLAYGPPFPIVVPTPDRQVGTLFNLSQFDAADAATHWLVTGCDVDASGAIVTVMEDDDRVYQMSDDQPVPPNPPLALTY